MFDLVRLVYVYIYIFIYTYIYIYKFSWEVCFCWLPEKSKKAS